MYLFDELHTYNKILRLAAQVELAVENFPKSTDYFSNRLIRSAKAVYRYYASAHNSGEPNPAKNNYWKARVSVEECIGLVEVAYRQGFLPPRLKDRFRRELSELSEEFQRLIRMAGPAPVPTVEPPVLTGPESNH